MARTSTSAPRPRKEREYILGAHVHRVFLEDPERVRRYAKDDVVEAAGLARLLGGAALRSQKWLRDATSA